MKEEGARRVICVELEDGRIRVRFAEFDPRRFPAAVEAGILDTGLSSAEKRSLARRAGAWDSYMWGWLGFLLASSEQPAEGGHCRRVPV